MYCHNEVHLHCITAQCTVYCRREYRDPECYSTYCSTAGFRCLRSETAFRKARCSTRSTECIGVLYSYIVGSEPRGTAILSHLRAQWTGLYHAHAIFSGALSRRRQSYHLPKSMIVPGDRTLVRPLRRCRIKLLMLCRLQIPSLKTPSKSRRRVDARSTMVVDGVLCVTDPVSPFLAWNVRVFYTSRL